MLSGKWGDAFIAEDGTRLAELVLEKPEAVVDFSRVQGMGYDFNKALFRRLAKEWGFDQIQARLHCAGLARFHGYFWRALAITIDEDVHRHPEWRQGLCWSCAGKLPKGGRKYCSIGCKVAAWEKRGSPGGRPPDEGPPPVGQFWVRKLKEAQMYGSKVEPDQVLKAISELVIENQVLKKENELLRAQLEYFKGTRTDLSNSKGYLPSDVLTAQEAADYLKIKVSTLNSWRSSGEQSIPYTKVGRSVRYRVADLDAFLFRSERSLANRVRSTEPDDGRN
ncbi:Helix-turn-helix domain protein [compost metagenome]